MADDGLREQEWYEASYLTLDELRQVAERANTGRAWSWGAGEKGYPQIITEMGRPSLIAECYEGPDNPSTLADFIATFDPLTVLRLIDQIEAARGEQVEQCDFVGESQRQTFGSLGGGMTMRCALDKGHGGMHRMSRD